MRRPRSRRVWAATFLHLPGSFGIAIGRGATLEKTTKKYLRILPACTVTAEVRAVLQLQIKHFKQSTTVLTLTLRPIAPGPTAAPE